MSGPSEPRFLTPEEVIVLQDLSIRIFGGEKGVRDRALLESALGQPRLGTASGYLYAYPFEMAAAYGFHLARNHPFYDGNKRIAWLAVQVFLERNGYSLAASTEDAVAVVLAVAAGTLDKSSLAEWIERRAVKH